MQYFDINLGATSTQEIGSPGRYLYYLTGVTPLIAGGVTPSAAGNQAIIVQAGGTGDSIVLMPGQSIRLDGGDKIPGSWRVSNHKRNEVITGQILIGSGEFRDSNILNTVKLDLTAANQVTVQNASIATTVSNEVEVKNDAGNPLNISVVGTPAVSISGTATVQENILAITGGGTSTAVFQNAVTQILSAGANVNGVIIQSAQGAFSNGGAGSGLAVLIKSGSFPAHIGDGITIAGAQVSSNQMGNFNMANKIRIPAGYSIAIVVGAANLLAAQAGVTFTAL